MTSLYIESENEISIVYPLPPLDVSVSVPESIWKRMESYVACRWSTAEIEYIVSAPCAIDWRPPAYPWIINSVDGDPAEVNDFGEVTLQPGRHRVVCTIGGQVVTAGVEEAYRRLAAYYADPDTRKGYSRYSVNLAGDISESWSRRAGTDGLAATGAAELLKKYRKAGIAHV
ncbi:hypothetical protein [Phaeovulum sp.]|uniref:hypothetical protein n=1 Tax=Phaeovulum sp. TaxID=2934796 RepID=UPI0039E6423B